MSAANDAALLAGSVVIGSSMRCFAVKSHTFGKPARRRRIRPASSASQAGVPSCKYWRVEGSAPMSVRSIAWSALLLLTIFPAALAQQFGDPAAGKRLAAANCAQCHGADGAHRRGACPRGDCRDALDDASVLERVLANATRLDAEPDPQRGGAKRPDRLYSEFAPVRRDAAPCLRLQGRIAPDWRRPFHERHAIVETVELPWVQP